MRVNVVIPAIASILILVGVVGVSFDDAYAHQLDTFLAFVFDPVSPVVEGTDVLMTGTVTTIFTDPHAAINPVTTGMSRIQQGDNADHSPASTCDPDHWHSLFPTTDPPVGGEFTHTFETDGLGGQTLVFRAMYVTPGGGHTVATTNGDCTPLVIETSSNRVCDDTNQLCKTVVITEEIDDGVIVVNELIQYDFTIELWNEDGQTWFFVTLEDHGFGADTNVGDPVVVDNDSPRDIDDMILDNLDCELTQKQNKSAKEKLDCIVDSIQGDIDEINPEGDLDFSDGEHASVSVTAYTDINPGQGKKAEPKREYTSCGIHSPNSGAVVEYFLAGEDPEIDDPHVLATPAIYVEVYDFADLSGDCDEDTVSDLDDNCPFTPNVGQEDNYGTDLGDACEDTDGDTVLDDTDVCPLVEDPNQEDTDSNGLGDACNDGEDADGDEYADGLDNCPVDANADQADTDTDGVGDACDMCPDSDPNFGPIDGWGCDTTQTDN